VAPGAAGEYAETVSSRSDSGRLVVVDATPLPPGPRGRILFLGPFQGGIGGLERITRCFADWVRDSGFTCTMIIRHVLPAGPNTVASDDRVRVLPERAWSRAVRETPWDYVYVIGAGLDRRRWLPRLARIAGVRILLDLDRKRKWLPIADVLHCEAPREGRLPVPHVVATPDPRPTMPPLVPPPPGPSAASGASGAFHLTAFTPYGSIKGHDEIPRFLAATGERLVWCFDLASWAARRRKLERACRQRIEAVRRAAPAGALDLVEAPSQDRLYDLYARCAGYVCFSRDESLGFSMLDAVALGKPLCARHIGVCRALDGFRATEDFGAPVFGTYALPEMLGYGALFEQVPRVLGGPAS
jgi:glycosyltransferase involved in cell wall biosynthesis